MFPKFPTLLNLTILCIKKSTVYCDEIVILLLVAKVGCVVCMCVCLIFKLRSKFCIAINFLFTSLQRNSEEENLSPNSKNLYFSALAQLALPSYFFPLTFGHFTYKNGPQIFFFFGNVSNVTTLSFLLKKTSFLYNLYLYK